MQEKLIKLLTIKIDAINKNIDNLNYLNEELETNNQDLVYLSGILDLFGTEHYDILNLDKLEKNDFDKVIEMIDSKVKNVFLDKTCNYQGIMYIIQGIRQGISLELTVEQENAINLFIDEIKVKNFDLTETINRLEESKERLPETDLEVLRKDLEIYNNIVLDFEKEKYLMEIEEVLLALDFAGISVEEKNDIFAYVLKYNRDIYEHERKKEEIKEESFISLPEVDITSFQPETRQEEIKNNDDEISESHQIKIEEDEPLEIANTVDLQEIIKKIDEKLKELEEKNKQLEASSVKEEPVLAETEEIEENEEDLELNLPIPEENSEEKVENVETQEKIENPLEGINFDEFKLPMPEPNLPPVTPIEISPVQMEDEDASLEIINTIPSLNIQPNEENTTLINVGEVVKEELPEIQEENFEEKQIFTETEEVTPLESSVLENEETLQEEVKAPSFDEVKLENQEEITTVTPNEVGLLEPEEQTEIKPVIEKTKEEETTLPSYEPTNQENLKSEEAITPEIEDVKSSTVETEPAKELTPSNEIEIIELLARNDLSDLKEDFLTKQPIDLNELQNNINVLIENQILAVFKEKNDILVKTLLNNNSNDLINVFTTIKKEYALSDKNYKDILPFFVVTLPILFTDLKVSKTFIANTEYFKSLNINLINLFDNYRELLIIDTDILKENYDKITKYGLTLNNDNVKYLLSNKNVLQNIDSYIEANAHEKGFLGRENAFDGVEYFTKHPYKLTNISRDILIKLRYATENNMKIYGNKPGILAGEITNPKVDLLNINEDYKNLYFDNEYGFMDRSELLDLLDSVKEYQEFDLTVDENIMKLDKLYKISDLRYEIEDLYFSRIKTIRLYNFLKNKNVDLKQALLIALTYNSVIKRDEYLKIENIINNLEGGN